MPKKEVEKNNKGTKKTTKTTAVKSTTKKSVKPSTTKNNNKKIVKVEKPVTKVEVKDVPVVTKEIKKGTNKKALLDNTPFVVSICIIILLTAICIYLIYYNAIPTTTNGEDIVASINGKEITVNELYDVLKKENGKTQLINIIDEFISDKEVTLTKEDEIYVDSIVEYYKEYAEYYNTDLETFLAQSGLSGIKTEKQFKEFLLKDYKKTLTVQKYIAEEASEDQLKKYYKENFSDSITAKHILIEIDSKEEDKEKADKEAYNKAKDIIKELDKIDSKKLSEEFGKLAEKNSDDTGTFNNGGLIENFTKKEVDENFYNAAAELKDGEYTKKPIKSTYGYHIILKVSSKAVEEYDKIKEDVKKSYAEAELTKDQNLFKNKWVELRKEYKLDINDEQINKEYNNDLKAEKTED